MKSDLTAEQIGRIADAVVAIRDDWDAGQVADYLEENHKDRPYPVLAAAAVFVAAQTFARNLGALGVEGHWWIQTPPPRPAGAAADRKLGPVRDEAWWAQFNLGLQARHARFGVPPYGQDETGADA